MSIHIDTDVHVIPFEKRITDTYTFIIRLFYFLGLETHVAIEIEAEGHGERKAMVEDLVVGG